MTRLELPIDSIKEYNKSTDHPNPETVKVLVYDLAFYDQFGHHIGEKTEAICDRIWIVVPK